MTYINNKVTAIETNGRIKPSVPANQRFFSSLSLALENIRFYAQNEKQDIYLTVVIFGTTQHKNEFVYKTRADIISPNAPSVLYLQQYVPAKNANQVIINIGNLVCLNPDYRPPYWNY